MSVSISGKQPQLLELFNAMAVLVDESTVEVTPEEMSFRAMDDSHIALLDIHIPSTDFSTYEVKSAVKFGVRTDEAVKILKRFGKDDTVKLELADNMLVLSNEAKTFKIRLLDISAINTPRPKLNFQSSATMLRTDFDKVLGDVQAVSDYVVVETKAGGNDNAITFSGRGDSGEVNITFLAEHKETKEDSKAAYSLDYLTKIVKAVSANTVTLEYSAKMPLKLTMGRIAYYLAPKIAE